MSLKKAALLIIFMFLNLVGYAQTDSTKVLPDKVRHVEPLYIDLVRDLGARKGEKELNVAADFKNTNNYNQYGVLAEYEFAPINRLGLEAEADFSFYKRTDPANEVPNNKLENLKLSAQYSFYVSLKHKTTLAIGYTHIFEFTDFRSYNNSRFITEMIYSPFFIAAKRWGDNFHVLVFTGPLIGHNFARRSTDVDWQINTSLDYSIPNSHNFVGIEFNKEIIDGKFKMTMRPQTKIQINKELAIGFVVGFPMNNDEQKVSSFFRLIYVLAD